VEEEVEMLQDLRTYINHWNKTGELKRISGVDARLEMGVITEEGMLRKGPALLFENIPGYRSSFRILTNVMATASRVSLALNLGNTYKTEGELVPLLMDKPKQWEERAALYSPTFVADGPVMENVLEVGDFDLADFPAPLWHERDGGRYLGTGCVVILRDPETGVINLGCYRVMLVDRDKVTVYISVGKHGNSIMKKYHLKGLTCPIAISLGQAPALLLAATLNVPPWISEYAYGGAILGERIEVIAGGETELPLPAYGEIVLEGECRPGETAPEGPFGEWTGYYGGEQRPAPLVRIKRVYHRHDPIVLGYSPAGRGDLYEVVYWHALLRSATLKKALIEAGVPGVRGVWPHEFGGARQFVVVSIKQEFSGHARQAGFVAAQCREGAYAGRFVVVVDDDIDPTDIKEVLWALCTRTDPVTDIEFIRRAWSTRLDPMKSPDSVPEAEAYYNTRAIIDACIPYERRKDFPLRNSYSPELKEAILKKWQDVFIPQER